MNLFKSEVAQTLAVQALSWILDDEDRLFPFLNQSGLAPDEIKNSLSDPQFLGGVIDFVLQNDAWVVECASALDIAPEDMMRLRQSLPGNEEYHWT